MPRLRSTTPAGVDRPAGPGVPPGASKRSPAALLVAVGALLVLVTTLLAAAPATAGPARAAQRPAARVDAGTEPLAVRIDTLTPSQLQPGDRGSVVVTGRVTNRDSVAWSRVNLYPFVSDAPLTTAPELADAVGTDPSAPVGDRRTDGGPDRTIERLAPGASASYRISIPIRRLRVSEPGVYWFGVHALGEGPDGRDDTADGRARTFLPLVGSRRETRGGVRAVRPTPLPASLVVPLRQRVAYAADGSIGRLREWTGLLRPGGRLDRLVDVGRQLPSATWLLDPALLDAVEQIAGGDRGRSLASTLREDGQPTASASPTTATTSPTGTAIDPGEDPSSAAAAAPSATPSATAGATPAPAATGRLRDPVVAAAAAAAQRWLPRALEALRGATVLALPYGDPDLSGLARHDARLYPALADRSAAALQARGLTSSPAAAAPDGYLSPEALALVGGGDGRRPATVVLADRAISRPSSAVRALPPVVRLGSTPAILASAAAADGGPGPTPARGDVALRQRILAEAALRLLPTGGRRPLVVALPDGWGPADPAGFAAGLRAPWLSYRDLTLLPQSGPSQTVAASRLRYPASVEALEIDGPRFAAAQALARAGSVLDAILPLNDRIGGVVEREAVATVSYGARGSASALARARAGQRAVQRTLDRVRISAPRGVTLSSATGRFSASVVNGLPVPVEVRIVAQSSAPLRISTPAPLRLPARGRATVLLDAVSDQAGVHNASLLLADRDDRPLGGRVAVPVRSAQVSMVIWLFLAVGLTLLFGTVALRTVRRLRARRRGAAPDGVDGALSDPRPQEPVR
ncbi:hypothetical protein K8Z61_13825 [Nocardioides sp. TRM66260-LWL]|uniref:DUF6049 family protein n=1 Tax=Nocardioides sp. TRM66260-LWL TaxID=2874478 RepID=UPI001CC52121|nr:DUF6049 family protein [Nocardioides sp. TRM66260-LWL]MBZ5735571.1 hypothetical protein [Nocardioides sp. TRM66260-LWL]